MLLSRFLLWFHLGQNAPRGSICPDDHHSRIVHHCKQTDSDNRDPLTLWIGLGTSERARNLAPQNAAQLVA